MSEQRYRVVAPEQNWTTEFLAKIKERDLVIYDGKACHAIRIIPRKRNNPIFEILGEDDGCLASYSYPIKFDLRWADGLISQLEAAKVYWETIKHNYEEDM